MSYGFLKAEKHIKKNSRKDGLAHSEYNIAYPIIQLFLFLSITLNQTHIKTKGVSIHQMISLDFE
jgi:hypothetical protein